MFATVSYVVEPVAVAIPKLPAWILTKHSGSLKSLNRLTIMNPYPIVFCQQMMKFKEGLGRKKNYARKQL
jgi:hypothetical protein